MLAGGDAYTGCDARGADDSSADDSGVSVRSLCTVADVVNSSTSSVVSPVVTIFRLLAAGSSQSSVSSGGRLTSRVGSSEPTAAAGAATCTPSMNDSPVTRFE